jgi:hypothetical protein
LLTACSNTPESKTVIEQCKERIVTVDTSCESFKLVTMTPAEVQLIRDGKITKETARLILANNETYTKRCTKSK